MNMLHILHLRHREDRMITLKQELITQGIKDYKIVFGFTDRSAKTNISRGHKSIVRMAKEQELPFVIIAEDDVKFTQHTSYRRFIETMPMDCDMYLASVYTGAIKEDNSVEMFCGMTLYAVFEKFFDTFLSLDENMHIDRALEGKGRYIVANPFLATQYPGYSDQRKRMALNDDDKLRGRKLYYGKE